MRIIMSVVKEMVQNFMVRDESELTQASMCKIYFSISALFLFVRVLLLLSWKVPFSYNILA